jgi:peptide/histidine transporter 3/4
MLFVELIYNQGRYHVLLASLIIATIGYGLISLSSHPVIDKTWIFFIGYVAFALGAGGSRPLLTVLGADQFNVNDAKQVKQQKDFFQYFYMFGNVAAALSSGLISHYASGGFGGPSGRLNYFYSFIISVASYVASLLLILLVSRKIYKPAHSGSALTNFIRICYYSACRSFYGFLVCLGFLLQFFSLGLSTITLAVDHVSLSALGVSLSFIGLGLMIFLNDNSWLRIAAKSGRFSEQFIFESMELLKLFPYIAFAAMFWCVYTQMSSTFQLQGCQMDTTLLRPGQLPMPIGVTIIAMVPVFNLVIFPLLARTGCPVTPFQRIGAGLLVASLTMVVAGTVEIYRRGSPYTNKLSECSYREGTPKPFQSDLSILTMIPQLVLSGLAEILAAITFSDFYYVEVPNNVRSVSQALSLLAISFGATINSNLIKVCESTGYIRDNLNQGNLEVFYFIIFALGLLNFVFFLIVSRRYVYTFS